MKLPPVIIGTLLPFLATGLPAQKGTDAAPAMRETAPVAGNYLGQTPPGATPEAFARGIVSMEATNEHSAPSFSPDGNEVFWWANRYPDPGPPLSMTTKRENGRWSAPRATPFEATMPAFSPDGRRVYFNAPRLRPATAQGTKPEHDIWFVERQGDG
jgi:hypothetical protein